MTSPSDFGHTFGDYGSIDQVLARGEITPSKPSANDMEAAAQWLLSYVTDEYEPAITDPNAQAFSNVIAWLDNTAEALRSKPKPTTLRHGWSVSRSPNRPGYRIHRGSAVVGGLFWERTVWVARIRSNSEWISFSSKDRFAATNAAIDALEESTS